MLGLQNLTISRDRARQLGNVFRDLPTTAKDEARGELLRAYHDNTFEPGARRAFRSSLRSAGFSPTELDGSAVMDPMAFLKLDPESQLGLLGDLRASRLERASELGNMVPGAKKALLAGLGAAEKELAAHYAGAGKGAATFQAPALHVIDFASDKPGIAGYRVELALETSDGTRAEHDLYFNRAGNLVGHNLSWERAGNQGGP